MAVNGTIMAVSEHNLVRAAVPFVVAAILGFCSFLFNSVMSLEQQVINGVSSGVTVGDTKRLVDNFLTREVQIQKASEGQAKVVSEFYNNIQTRFGTPGGNNSLSADLSRFGAALETLAINPEDPALRFNVVSTGVSVARGISQLAAGMQS